MTTTLTARPATGSTHVAAYGLGRPTVVDARASIERIYRGAEADRVWLTIVGPVLGARRAAPTIEEVIATMLTSADDIVRLCGTSLEIRMLSYTRLAAGGIIS